MKKYMIFGLALLASAMVQAQTQELDQLRAIAVNQPANAQNWVKLGKASDKYATQMRAKGDLNAAITAATEAQDYFQMATGVAPHDAQVWKEVAMHYYQRESTAPRNAQAAITYLQRVEALNPNDLEILTALHQAYGAIGQSAKAQVFEQRVREVKAGARQSAYHKF